MADQTPTPTRPDMERALLRDSNGARLLYAALPCACGRWSCDVHEWRGGFPRAFRGDSYHLAEEWRP